MARRKGAAVPRKRKKRGTHHRVKAHSRITKSGKKVRVKGHPRKHPSRGRSPGDNAIRVTQMSPF